MQSKKFLLMFILALFFHGCTTRIVSSGKTSSFEEPISSLNIVFVETDLGKNVNPYVVNAVNQDRLNLGVQISERMPASLATKNIESSSKSLAPSSIPNNIKGYQELFPTTPNAPILFINPISAFTTCPNNCFQFRMQVKLVNTTSGKVIWTSTVDIPPKASRFHDYSGVVDDFSSAILIQLQKDGVLKGI